MKIFEVSCISLLKEHYLIVAMIMLALFFLALLLILKKEGEKINRENILGMLMDFFNVADFKKSVRYAIKVFPNPLLAIKELRDENSKNTKA